MEEHFVSFEQAKTLKEYGFDEPCFGWYAKDGSFYLDRRVTIDQGLLLAPLTLQALNWFRAEGPLRLSGVVKHYLSGTYSYNISRHDGGNVGWNRVSAFIEKGFYNYHDAESACLDKVIEIYEDILKENPPFSGGNR